MSVTVADIKKWIADSGLTDESAVSLDGDGALIADVPGKVAVAYLLVGFLDNPEVK